ncbi:hypothetical protein [Deinococcus fonticola]|uniref:hypothetical protein n=1 Tax=Deinococcus fonticola TaxID=2528713 RepID=UPI001074C15A|nr:hypothetical protein [Deinococcus fonticola]
MTLKVAFPVLVSAVLVGCGIPIPNGVNLDIPGPYAASVRGLQGQDAYEVVISTQGLSASATFRHRLSGQQFTLTGQRSSEGATPVQLNLTGYAGSGSVCQGGATDYFTSSFTFYASKPGKAYGNLWRESCDAASKEFRINPAGAGVLELTKG